MNHQDSPTTRHVIQKIWWLLGLIIYLPIFALSIWVLMRAHWNPWLILFAILSLPWTLRFKNFFP